MKFRVPFFPLICGITEGLAGGCNPDSNVPDGTSAVLGGRAYFLEARRAPGGLQAQGLPPVWRRRGTPAGAKFDVSKWAGGGDNYTLGTRQGKVNARGSQHGVY